MSPPTLLVTAAALTASLAHVLIDQFIGLSGRASMSPAPAAYVIAVAAVCGYPAARALP